MPSGVLNGTASQLEGLPASVAGLLSAGFWDSLWGLIQGTLNMDQVPRIAAKAPLETGRPLIDIVNSSDRYAEDKTSMGLPFKS